MPYERAFAHQLVDDIYDIIEAKNKDYGDSFKITGTLGATTRIFDKAMRLFTISKNKKTEVNETLQETLRDLIAYCFMLFENIAKGDDNN